MSRATVNKTYKLFAGGKFIRSESGRYLKSKVEGVNICYGSRKDLRNAVQSARKGLEPWSSTSAFNRSQVLYRMAEMLEARSSEFVSELESIGIKKAAAVSQVQKSVDRTIHYAGWCDKATQLFSSVNPVASNHFNFSSYEPQGVVGVVVPNSGGLLGLVSLMLPVLAGGNAVIVLTEGETMQIGSAFGEVVATSDVPAGVINILSSKHKELVPQIVSHMDVNGAVVCGLNQKELKAIQIEATENMKRVISSDGKKSWNDKYWENPNHVIACQELKTTWHPIERINAAGATY